jgi:hypothetical protein
MEVDEQPKRDIQIMYLACTGRERLGVSRYNVKAKECFAS